MSSNDAVDGDQGSALPPGVTRYPLHLTTSSGSPSRGYLLVFAALVAAYVVYGVLTHPDPVRVLAVSGGALVLGALVYVLSPRAAKIPFVAVFVLVAGAGAGRDRDFVIAGLAVMCGSLGAVLVIEPLRRRARARRAAQSEGAPPLDRDPRTHLDLGSMAIWDDGVWQYEAGEPSVDLMLEQVRAMDGRTRSSVVIFHGISTLFVGGDAGASGDRGEAGMVVVQVEDRNKVWTHALVNADAAARGPEAYTDSGRLTQGERVQVPVSQTVMKMQPGHVVHDLEAVERAVRHFMRTGDRDPAATWYESTRNHPVERPVVWRIFDYRASSMY